MTRGITLIETIIYIAILGFVSTSFMVMSLNLISLKTKSVANQEVTANLRYLTSRLNYEIRNAPAFVSISPTSLSLSNSRLIDFTNGNLRLGVGISGDCSVSSPCNLNSNLVNVSNFSLVNLSSGDSRTQNIQYSFTVSYKNSQQRTEFTAVGTVKDSVELR